MSKVVNFFATRKDSLDVFIEVESARSIHYASAGMFETPETVVYPSALQIPDLGVIRVPDAALGRGLLLADSTTSFTSEPIPQRRGGVRYAVDQATNPDTVDLSPGGQFDPKTIIAGRLGTSTDSLLSADLLRMIANVVRRRWVKVKSYFVGPESLTVLDAGGRLTTGLRSPGEYDLRR